MTAARGLEAGRAAEPSAIEAVWVVRERAAPRPATPSSITRHSGRPYLVETNAAVFLLCLLRSFYRRESKHRQFLPLRSGLPVLQSLSRKPSRPSLLLDDRAHWSVKSVPVNLLAAMTFLDHPSAVPPADHSSKKHASSLAVEPGHAIRISWGNMGCEGVAYNMSRNKLLLATEVFSSGLTSGAQWIRSTHNYLQVDRGMKGRTD